MADRLREIRELGSILAGLQLLKARVTDNPLSVAEIEMLSSQAGNIKSLTGEEIELLCDRLVSEAEQNENH